MITGRVSAEGVPLVAVTLAGSSWEAMIDTGFNSDMELPEPLRAFVNPRSLGQVYSVLAGNVTIQEELFEVDFPFDGTVMTAEATFVPGQEILIGTRLLSRYRLEVNFVQRTVLLERVP